LRKAVSRFFKGLERREQRYFLLAVTYLLLYEILIQILLPSYINDKVIYSIGALLVTVEGILVALSPQISEKGTRDLVAVGIGIPALLLSLTTVAVAYYQSIQLNYLSQDLETILFRLDNALFGFLVEVYAIGILGIKSKGTSNNGSDVEATKVQPDSHPLRASETESSPQASGENIPDLIDTVDDKFSEKKVPMLQGWLILVFAVFTVIYVGIVSYSDLAVRIGITVGGVGVLLAMMQIVLDQYKSWIVDANYQRLRKGGDENPILYALIMMKTASPDILLRNTYRLSKTLFDSQALIERLYN